MDGVQSMTNESEEKGEGYIDFNAHELREDDGKEDEEDGDCHVRSLKPPPRLHVRIFNTWRVV